MKLFKFVIIALATIAIPVTANAAGLACKTAQGKKCVCATNSPKKCATTAKARCLSGETVEPTATPGELKSAHENNQELFRLCQEKGGLKEIVYNNPVVDALHTTPAPKQATTAGD